MPLYWQTKCKIVVEGNLHPTFIIYCDVRRFRDFYHKVLSTYLLTQADSVINISVCVNVNVNVNRTFI